MEISLGSNITLTVSLTAIKIQLKLIQADKRCETHSLASPCISGDSVTALSKGERDPRKC